MTKTNKFNWVLIFIGVVSFVMVQTARADQTIIAEVHCPTGLYEIVPYGDGVYFYCYEQDPAPTEIVTETTTAVPTWSPTVTDVLPTETIEPTNAPTASATASHTLEPDPQPSASSTLAPTEEQTATYTYTLTVEPSPVFSDTPTPTLVFDPTEVSTQTLEPTLVATSTQEPTQEPSPTPAGGDFIIDHTSIALFDQIPEVYSSAAEAIRMVFMDRSVGSNINDGLSCLAAPTWESSPSHCRRDYIDETLISWKTFTLRDTDIPALIQFPGGNDRSNIYYTYASGSWEADVNTFIDSFAQYAGYDIYTFQHNYLHVMPGSTIDEVYFDPDYPGANIFDLLELELAYPDHIFIYWTTSLARTIGTADAQSFNDQMRNWARENNKFLLDVADIESHAPDGSACLNEAGYEIICQQYTTELEGGHLGSVSGGKIQIAKAIWVLLAQIAGWQP